MTLRFVVPGQPIGKGRATPLQFGGNVRMVAPKKTARYENLIAMLAQERWNGKPLIEGPISVLVIADFTIPMSWPKKKQAMALSGELRPCVKPDGDNILKAVCDSLNGVVYRDDTQAVDCRVIKRYAAIPQLWVEVAECEYVATPVQAEIIANQRFAMERA